MGFLIQHAANLEPLLGAIFGAGGLEAGQCAVLEHEAKAGMQDIPSAGAEHQIDVFTQSRDVFDIEQHAFR